MRHLSVLLPVLVTLASAGAPGCSSPSGDVELLASQEDPPNAEGTCKASVGVHRGALDIVAILDLPSSGAEDVGPGDVVAGAGGPRL